MPNDAHCACGLCSSAPHWSHCSPCARWICRLGKLSRAQGAICRCTRGGRSVDKAWFVALPQSRTRSGTPCILSLPHLAPPRLQVSTLQWSCEPVVTQRWPSASPWQKIRRSGLPGSARQDSRHRACDCFRCGWEFRAGSCELAPGCSHGDACELPPHFHH